MIARLDPHSGRYCSRTQSMGRLVHTFAGAQAHTVARRLAAGSQLMLQDLNHTLLRMAKVRCEWASAVVRRARDRRSYGGLRTSSQERFVHQSSQGCLLCFFTVSMRAQAVAVSEDARGEVKAHRYPGRKYLRSYASTSTATTDAACSRRTRVHALQPGHLGRPLLTVVRPESRASASSSAIRLERGPGPATAIRPAHSGAPPPSAAQQRCIAALRQDTPLGAAPAARHHRANVSNVGTPVQS